MAAAKGTTPTKAAYTPRNPKGKKKNHKASWLAKHGGLATMLCHGNAAHQVEAGKEIDEMFDKGTAQAVSSSCADIVKRARTEFKDIAKPYIGVAIIKSTKKMWPGVLRQMFPADLI